MKYKDAIGEAIYQYMKDNPKALLLGEGVGDEKGVFTTCLKAQEHFSNRVIETPLSETALTGMLLGMAIEGWKPIYCHARVDFSLFSYEHLINTIAKHEWLYGKPCPITIRMIIGRGWGQGPTHSQNFASHLADVPGLNVYIPVTSLTYSALFSDLSNAHHPRIFIEPRRLYDTELAVPEDSWGEVAIVTIGDCYLDALEAAKILAANDISASVTPAENLTAWRNPTTWKFSHIHETPVLVVESSNSSCGLEIIGALQPYMKGLPRMLRLSPPFSPLPVSKPLEDAWYPTAQDIVRAACELLEKPTPKIFVENVTEANIFRGPF